MIVTNDLIACPHCRKPLHRRFRLAENIPWSPNVHPCERCCIRLFSWNIFSQSVGPLKVILPLNNFQFDHLVEDLRKTTFGYYEEDPLVVTEAEYKEYREVFKMEGLKLIKKIYEHKEKMRSHAFN